MAGKGETWTTIESDPGVFTELVEQIGVKGVQYAKGWYDYPLEDVNAIPSGHKMLYNVVKRLTRRPVYGLIFLFKWQPDIDERAVAHDTLGQVFFANQVINNACATQAILAVLLNCPQLELGQELTNFREFTAEFPPDVKGLAISNSESIRAAHNSFARPEPIVPDEDRLAGKDDDAFHFISYVPVNGTLYELDGLKPGPIALCSASQEDWLEKVGPVIQERMERYAASEIRFNLMAMIKDRREVLQEKIQALEASRSDAMQIDGPDSVHIDTELASLYEQLAEESAKRARWHDENVRRKHNYIPFLFNLLQYMAKQGQLKPIIAQARERKDPKEHK